MFVALMLSCCSRTFTDAVQAIYLAYRAGLHWSSFSSYHIFGYLVLLVVSVVCKSMLVEAAASSTGSE